jgi:hypothetical protein
LIGGYAREFGEFSYQTRSSWSRERRVIGKAEILPKGENPRIIVTNPPKDGFNPEQVERFTATACYEEFYCARGDMENRIKGLQLDLFANRTSTHFLESNQLRLYLSTFAYFLMERLRALALNGTQLAQDTAGTIRLRIIKIAANVSISVRRIYIRFASAFPLKEIFSLAQKRIMNLASSIT